MYKLNLLQLIVYIVTFSRTSDMKTKSFNLRLIYIILFTEHFLFKLHNLCTSEGWCTRFMQNVLQHFSIPIISKQVPIT